MGSGPSPRSNTPTVPGRKEALSDGDGGLSISCPEDGRLRLTLLAPEAIAGVEGELRAAGDTINFVVNGKVIGRAAGVNARRLARCIGEGFTYLGELERTRERTTVRYWMA